LAFLSMMNLSQNQIVLGILLGGTSFGALGTIATRVVVSEKLAIPEDAEIIDPSTGIVAPKDTPLAASTPVFQPSTAPKADKRALIDPIIRRNMFDSTKVGQVAESSDEGETGNKTSLPLVLLATMVATPEQFSSALISEEKGGDGAMGYGIGDPVIGEATIHRIEQKRVILKRNDGELEYLAMDDSKLPEIRTGEDAKSSKSGKWDGVEKDGETKFTIDEETFNKILENPDKLASQIRAVPHTDESGNVDGYRMSGIRRSSLFRKLGIKNGDVVHSVNGNNLTSVSSAMKAYESLQSERNFNFEVTTRKKKKTYEYEVR
jgi:general secretion pathway protein C